MKTPRAGTEIPSQASNLGDERLGLSRLLLFGLQHVLVMYAGAVAVPLIIGRALQLPAEEVGFLISADLFACGIATVIQSLGLPGIGIRLPVMMGVTFASVAPMLSLIVAGAASGTPKEGTLGVIYGSVISAGIFGLLAAPFISRLSRLFPPVVTGSVILVIGVSLMRIGIDWAAGGQPSQPDYGAPLHLGVALFVLIAILAITKFARGLIRSVAVLLGVIAGSMLAVLLNQMSFDKVIAAKWFGLVTPFHFGVPRFDPMAIVTMCLVMIVVMVESFGMFLAVAKMVDRPLSRDDITRGLRADALGAIIGGIFNTFPYTSFSQNIGLVGATGIRSRFVCVSGGVIMLLLGLSPKLAVLVEAVPSFVLGGAGIVLFGMVAATGIRILAGVDFAARNNLFTVAISVALGMIPLVAPKFFQFMPPALNPLLGSGVLITTVSAVLLNGYFNGFSTAAQNPREPAGIHDAPHL